MKPVFFRMDREVPGGFRTPSTPAHPFTTHAAVEGVCEFCGFRLKDHPWKDEQIAQARRELLIMAADPSDPRLHTR